jgi:hypothetical protein
VRACHDEVVHVVGPDASGLPQSIQRVGAELAVAHLAEALLPHPRPLLARDPPAVHELVGYRDPGTHLGHHFPLHVCAHHYCGRAVAEERLVGASGQASAQVCRHRQRGSTLERGGAQRSQGAAHRADEVVRAAFSGEPQRRLQHGGVRLVEVGRGHRGEPDGLERDVGRPPQRDAPRLNRHGRGVFVERGN